MGVIFSELNVKDIFLIMGINFFYLNSEKKSWDEFIIEKQFFSLIGYDVFDYFYFFTVNSMRLLFSELSVKDIFMVLEIIFFHLNSGKKYLDER